MKNILVTGGAGFIGSHTCLLLLEKGYKVNIIDSFLNSSQKSINGVLEILKLRKLRQAPKINIFKGDLRDKVFLEDVFKVLNNNKVIDGVIHFAGLKAVEESIRNPLEYWECNVLGTINLLEIMDRYGCNNLVFSSSASIYSQKGNFLLKESSDIKPINPYGNTKFTIEMLLSDIYKSSLKNKRFASLRYFNPIGAHSSGLIGENPIGTPSNIFPIIVNTALGIQEKLKIYGNDWPTKDGTAVRDYIHVMDLAEAHIRVLEKLFNQEKIHINLNIGTGVGTSVLELVKTFEKINNVKVPYIFAKRRKGDSSYVVADNSSMISKLNITSMRSIEIMCKDGWRWKSRNPNGY